MVGLQGAPDSCSIWKLWLGRGSRRPSHPQIGGRTPLVIGRVVATSPWHTDLGASASGNSMDSAGNCHSPATFMDTLLSS